MNKERTYRVTTPPREIAWSEVVPSKEQRDTVVSTHVELLAIYPLLSAGVNWSEARGWYFLTVNAQCRKTADNFTTRDMFTKYMLSSAVN